MKIRSTDSNHPSGILSFCGIKGQDKVKAFLMADLLTYFAIRRFSTIYICRSDSKNEVMISKIASSVKYLVKDYSGFTAGTPADQISKRVDNMVRLLRGTKQEMIEDKPAIIVDEENLDFYHNVCYKKTNLPQPSVKVNLSSGRFKEEFGRHVPFSALIDWISSDIIRSSINDPSLLVIYKLVNDTVRRVKEYISIAEDLLTEIVNLFLSLLCIFKNDLDTMGETSEFTFDDTSLSVLFPSFDRFPTGNGLLVIKDCNVDIDVDSIKAKCGFTAAEIIGKCVHPFEMEMNCYHSQIVLGNVYSAIIITEDRSLLDAFNNIINAMEWHPEAIILVTNTIPYTQLSESIIRIETSRCTEDIIYKCTIGVSHSDDYATAILRTVFKDLFYAVYGGQMKIFSSNDPVDIINSMQNYDVENQMPNRGKYSELLVSILSMLK